MRCMRATSARADDCSRKMGSRLQHGERAVNDAGNLSVDGVDLAELADEYGTPLHVVSHSRLLADYTRFEKSFTSLYPKTAIGYSYKTNPLPGVIKALHDAGALAEVISHFELWLAIELGVPAERIVFNGPGKTRDAIELAVHHGSRHDQH